MRRLNNLLEPFSNDGDWHSRLLAALEQAEKETSSSQLLMTIPWFREVLLENDECLHQVTLTKILWGDMSFEHACKYLEEAGVGKKMSIRLINDDTISLTVTMRGSITYVSHWANTILNEGLRWAWFEWLEQKIAQSKASKSKSQK